MRYLHVIVDITCGGLNLFEKYELYRTYYVFVIQLQWGFLLEHVTVTWLKY